MNSLCLYTVMLQIHAVAYFLRSVSINSNMPVLLAFLFCSLITLHILLKLYGIMNSHFFFFFFILDKLKGPSLKTSIKDVDMKLCTCSHVAFYVIL